MPQAKGVAVLRATLEDASGRVLHRNFTSFVVGEGPSPLDETLAEQGRRLRVLRVAPDRVSEARWSERHWTAMDGRKQNGAGAGFFEYRLAWPAGLRPRRSWRAGGAGASSSSAKTRKAPPSRKATSCAARARTTLASIRTPTR
jgi:hypothetical protein